MDDLIQLKSGALGDKESMPKLSDRELGYITDQQELHIGTNGGNIKIGDAKWENRLTNIENQIQTIISRLDALSPSE